WHTFRTAAIGWVLNIISSKVPVSRIDLHPQVTDFSKTILAHSATRGDNSQPAAAVGQNLCRAINLRKDAALSVFRGMQADLHRPHLFYLRMRPSKANLDT